MEDAKPRNGRRVALGMTGAALAWLLGVWPPPVWWRDHWPRETAMMREADRWNQGTVERANRPTFHPTALKDISPALQRMVIIAEDSRFWTHHGIDPAEVADALGLNNARGFWPVVREAWRHRDRLRGASTLTQQLAKNLYLSPSRSPLRKVKEAATALRLEAALSKDRILELYLNLAEWGPGIWGVDAASHAYFGVPPSRLTEEQAGELAATLPHPRSSNPIFRPDRMLTRRSLILARYHGVDVNIPPEEETDTVPVPTVLLPPAESLRIEVPSVVDSLEDSLTARRTDAQGKADSGGRDSLP
ncbi:MAG: monofunctional biosynthetic peptidoglycan transglycosylase [Gemmatimonadetes bacterium]|nr:MAG: monofunctional biosynthetic peptidoglycan transglycosylase [Gemmatimonadota bacterium]